MELTGRQLVEWHGCRVLSGPRDEYDWWHEVIYLTDQTANGSDANARLSALHELAHWWQYREMPWLFWMLWLRPVRWWIEMDAWRRALAMM